MPESKGRILWVDDEVDLLRPHIQMLQEKGFDVETATNGEDALARVAEQHFDLILLDESMPGIGGLQTLDGLKQMRPLLPVIMVTKNEAEELVEEAIGKKITDYLTKPVNPTQVHVAIKKILEGHKIRGSRTAQEYIADFNAITMELSTHLDLDAWIGVYSRLVEWSLELDKHQELNLHQTLSDQWRECNQQYCRFFEKNYRDWIEDDNIALSPNVVDRYLLPRLESGGPVFFFVIDCLRYDQWLLMERHLQPHFRISRDFYLGILPTATPYARNAIFSGLYPSDLTRVDPEMWSRDDDDYSMNKHEKEFLEQLLLRRRVKLRNDLRYIKILETEFGKNIAENFTSNAGNHLTAVVVNFVDMLAHSRSDYPILKEIAPNEAAYRSLTESWFRYSSLLSMFQQIARIPKATLIVTTDHGSVRCMRGSKVLGDRDTSTNLRYKYGRNVKPDARHAMNIQNAKDYRLPPRGMVSNYVIAKEDYYFVYPTDYNKYLQQYRDSFQHGGISLEETILPVVTLESLA